MEVFKWNFFFRQIAQHSLLFCSFQTESESKTPSVNSDATEPPESKPVAQDASHLLIKSSPINVSSEIWQNNFSLM